MPDLSTFTLLLPSVSVGNVGQLAIDVVLATLRPILVSQVWRGAPRTSLLAPRWCTPP